MTYHIGTFGCQMNARDSERIAGMLEEMGFVRAAGEADAGVVVYNTCCVRGHAESRVFGRLSYLKHLKTENAKAGMDAPKIVLCGCMAQRPDVIEVIKEKYKFVDVVVGTFNLRRLPELLNTARETGRQVIDVWETHDEWDEQYPERREFPNKAGVNISYGCDNYCTYCIVPYVRGRERSRKPSEILREAERLIGEGVKEITLLGQNVNSYGLAEGDKERFGEACGFPELLRRASALGAERVKFLTSHPKDLSDELIETIADTPALCKYIHLPAQSGSSAVLAKMNRGYDKERYLSVIEKIRKGITNCYITTDIIVGFPGETEDDFEDTLDVCRRARFSGAYTFIYSKRPGTPAAEMDGQLPHEIVAERFKRLLAVTTPICEEIAKAREGAEIFALPDSEAPDAKTGRYKFKTEDNITVHVKAAAVDGLGWRKVRITEGKAFYLLGEI